MSAVSLTIVLDEARLETGLWCHRCLLPSGWRIPLLTLTVAGIGQLGVLARCDDCDNPLGTP